MAITPAPHRVTFLAARLTLPAGDDGLEGTCALLLGAALSESLARHPVVAVADLEDFPVLDDAGVPLGTAHPAWASVRDAELLEGRRDELLWFDVSLDPARPRPTTLHALKPDGSSDEWQALGEHPLSRAFSTCLTQWLAARHLPPSPRPMEPFAHAEVVTAAGHLQRVIASGRAGLGSGVPPRPPRLAIPFLRVLDVRLGADVLESVRGLDPRNPWVLVQDLLLTTEGPGAHDLARDVVSEAPQWARPHLALASFELDPRARARTLTTAVRLAPRSPKALVMASEALARVGRFEEARRLAIRAAARAPAWVPAHLAAVDALAETPHAGEAWREASERLGFLESLVTTRELSSSDPDLAVFRLRVSSLAFGLGQLEEAIRLREGALRDAPAQGLWRDARKELEAWRGATEPFALAWARDGAIRDEPWRVLDGLSRARPEDDADVALLLGALDHLGKANLGLIAAGVWRGLGHVPRPTLRLAEARGALDAGDLDRTLEHLQALGVGAPQARLAGPTERLLRVAACRPIGEWETALERRREAGATTLARLLARDAADFVPGASESQAVLASLGPGRNVAFDPAWLEPLRELLAPYGLDAIDALFAELDRPEGGLEYADRMVVGWPAALAPARAEDPTRAAQALYLLAQALGRYLARTTQAPNPVAGGLRQVATAALGCVRRATFEYPPDVLAPLAAMLEKIIPSVEPWVADPWVLRVERALDLDVAGATRPGGLLHGHAHVADLARGDERIAFELRLGEQLLELSDAASATILLVRSLRAVGGDAAPAVAMAANAGGPDGLDLAWLAVCAAPEHAPARIVLARLLFDRDQAELAFQVLARAPSLAGDDARRGLSSIAGAWTSAELDVPLAAGEARTLGEAHLAAGDLPRAIRCLRWARVVDPGFPGEARHRALHDALGTAYAGCGMAREAVASFAAVEPRTAPRRAGIALANAGHRVPALAALRVATWIVGGFEDWLALAEHAARSGDDELAGDAYGRAAALADPDGQPATLLARGMAALWQGRGAEALRLAQQGLEETPGPFGPSLEALAERARTGDQPGLRPRRERDGAERALEALASGDVDGALGLAGPAQSWGLWRTTLVASRWRGPVEDGALPSAAARELVERTLGASSAVMDPDAAWCRVLCLAVRDAELLETAPPLGPPRAIASRERFQRGLAERGERTRRDDVRPRPEVRS